MNTSVVAALAGAILLAALPTALFAQPGTRSLDPRGRIHIPIGLANTLDTLKTFVEAEGCYSPGFATYGVYFWVFDRQTGRLVAPTQDDVACRRGLGGTGYLIPWTAWGVDDLAVKTEVCEVCRASPAGDVFVVGSRVHLSNTGERDRRVSLYVAIRPLGPAGGPVGKLAVSDRGDALLVEGRPALVANERPSAAGVLPTDTIGQVAMAGGMPAASIADSDAGDCSGALRFDLTVAAGQTRILGFVCPVLPGRRAVGHRWDGKSQWAQFDLAKPNPAEGGALQPDPGLEYCRALRADTLFDEARRYWKDSVGRATIDVPDRRWAEAFSAIAGHVAVAMNEGAPDVAVVNYNVFNRDGVYTVNILQKSGRFDLAAQAIEYFLAHPFSGRVYPEADNPGQILWVMGRHWLFTRDAAWLERVYPCVRKLASLVEYCRAAPGPHWVALDGLAFGDALAPEKRRELKPGRCDGYHPEYTEAFDIAGLRAAVILAEALRCNADACAWRGLADSLVEAYDERFGDRLGEGYGGFAVLWPCRLYPLGRGKGCEEFKRAGARAPGGWRYFPLAAAHQGLLAGNRGAGHKTVQMHLDHPQMAGWYALDEGGKSGAGGWGHVRTTWNPNVAMPHGWAVAELWLLLRDSLLFEDGGRLVLLAGVSPDWFTAKDPVIVEGLPTHFGPCAFAYRASEGGATLTFSGSAAPPEGFVLCLPPSLRAKVTGDGKPLGRSAAGDVPLPPRTKRVEVIFSNQGEARPPPARRDGGKM